MDGAPINKTMDRDDLFRADCQAVLEELFELMRLMQSRSAWYSSWYGRVNAWPSVWEHVNRGEGYEPWPGNPDEFRIPWFLLWEIAWLVTQTPLRPGSCVLDMGGAGSLFSSYLASKGCEVHAIDIDAALFEQAAASARVMGWNVQPRVMDMTLLDYPDGSFDHVFSVCVFEHLPVSGRIACNQQVCRVLKPGGTASYTFDYRNPQSFGRIDTPDDVLRQFVEPSGLALYGSRDFWDCGKRYLEPPQLFGFGRVNRWVAAVHAVLTRSVEARRVIEGDTAYTFGSVFMRKSGEKRQNH